MDLCLISQRCGAVISCILYLLSNMSRDSTEEEVKKYPKEGLIS